MALVISDMSISLDGYVTGPNDSRENPFGDGAEMLHDWIFDAATDDDRAILQATLDGVGAIVMGRTSFDKNEGDGGWGDAGPVGRHPVLRGHSPHADCVVPARVHVRHRRCGQRHRAGQERSG